MKLMRFTKNKSFWVISIFSALLTFSFSSYASPKDGSKTFHAAKAYTINGKSYDHVTVEIKDKTTLEIRGCESCTPDTYNYLSTESDIIGKSIFKLTETDYIFVEEDGLLIWAKFPKGLGKKNWSRNDPYNILAKERTYVRQLYTNAEMQNNIKKTLSTYSRSVKKELKKMKNESLTMR